MTTQTPQEYVKQIVQALGGTSKVAQMCDIKMPAVSQWIERGEIPKARVMYFKLIRPDLF